MRAALRFLFAVLLLCLACPLGWATPACAQEFIGTRPFRGLVRQDLASGAARAAVTIYATEQAMRELAQHPDMQFASASRYTAPLGAQELAGLVRMLYTISTTKTEVEGFPPEMHAMVQVGIAPKADFRARLYYAMTHREHLGIYSRIHEQQQQLLEAYDALAPTLLRISQDAMTGKEKLLALQSLVQRLAALEKFEALLPSLTDRWETPAEAQIRLQTFLKVDPQNPLYLTALAETLIQLDRPAEAQAYAAEAVTQQPDYARAHDIYGTILLRRRLPALAAKAFGEAIALAPALAEYRLHRAAAFLVQEEIDGMCQDLHTACVYGQCEQYEWARDIGKCGPAQTAPSAIAHGQQRPGGNGTGGNGTGGNGTDAAPALQPAQALPIQLDKEARLPTPATEEAQASTPAPPVSSPLAPPAQNATAPEHPASNATVHTNKNASFTASNGDGALPEAGTKGTASPTGANATTPPALEQP